MGRRKPAQVDPIGNDLRAHDDNGNVRPADGRYLDDDQLAARDLYIESEQSEEEKRIGEILQAAGSSAAPDQEATE